MNPNSPGNDMDSPFEPMQRARSNTWPLPKPDNFEEKLDATAVAVKCEPNDSQFPSIESQTNLDISSVPLPHGSSIHSGQIKKNSSRRNAWGNHSYADLITQAISSAPENRLTLSQIYEWMVHNVPYFKDKGDNNSSAGWKNSIRHNLSLHNRFIRVQNEGTGKSSWWMLNPDAKPGKSVRRRATSMETSKFEKRRGRVKKKVDAIRNTLQATGISSSGMIDTLDLFADSPLHGFQMSPDCRTRASSNASSCSRLSPIISVDQDWTMNCNSCIQPDQLAGDLEQSMRINQTDQQPPLCGMSPSLSYFPHHPLTAFSTQPPFERVATTQTTSSQKENSSRSTTSSPVVETHLAAVNQNSLDDLNINFESIEGGFDCNVDEVIKHELSIGGSLDFNFTANQTQSVTSDEQQPTSNSNHDQLPFSGQSWVH